MHTLEEVQITHLKPFKLLIIDDHPLFRLGLKFLFHQQTYIQCVIEAACGLSGLEQWRWHKPEVVLLDISMEGMSGLSCLKSMHSNGRQTQVIALSRFDETSGVNAMMNAGAIGSIKKCLEEDMFIKSFESLLRLSPSKSTKNESPGKLNLQKRELEVISLLSYSLSSKEIAARLNICKSTVDNHRKNIIKKTGLSNTTGVVAWAIQNGIIDNPGKQNQHLSKIHRYGD